MRCKEARAAGGVPAGQTPGKKPRSKFSYRSLRVRVETVGVADLSEMSEHRPACCTTDEDHVLLQMGFNPSEMPGRKDPS